MSTEQFYDQLAGTYHWLYREWHAEVASQAAALHQLRPDGTTERSTSSTPPAGSGHS